MTPLPVGESGLGMVPHQTCAEFLSSLSVGWRWRDSQDRLVLIAFKVLDWNKLVTGGFWRYTQSAPHVRIAAAQAALS